MKRCVVLPCAVMVLLMLLAPAAELLLAQGPGQVRVILRRPPPNQLKVSDLWQLELLNTTDRTFTAYAVGEANEANDGLIVNATTSLFRIPPGRTVLYGDQLQPITVNESHPDYRDEVLRTGSVRSGQYRVCVEVFTAETDSLIGLDCYDQTVEQFSPPILISPIEGRRVTERPVVFTWLPPGPSKTGRMIQYRIKVAELLGRQSPIDAIRSNPAFFNRNDLRATVLPYPIVGAREFDTSRMYAWQITAYDRGSTGREYIIGTSEVETFSVGRTNPDIGIVSDPRLPDRRWPSRLPIGPPNLSPGADPTGGKNRLLLPSNALELGLIPPYRLVDIDKLRVPPTIPNSVLQELLRHCNE